MIDDKEGGEDGPEEDTTGAYNVPNTSDAPAAQEPQIARQPRLDIYYYEKEADQGRVASLLRAADIDFQAQSSTVNPQSFQKNSIACHAAAPVNELKALARYLIEGGIKIQEIRRFQNPNKAADRIELLTVADFDHNGERVPLTSEPLSLEQIESLSECPVVLTNAPQPEVSWAFYGIKEPSGWRQTNFEIIGGESGYPDIGEQVTPSTSVNLEAGPVEYVDGRWQNKLSLGVGRPGVLYQITDVVEVFPGYVWVELRDQRY